MIRLGVIQAQTVAGDTAANLDRLYFYLAQARAAGVTLLVTPELFVQGYGAGEAMASLAWHAGHPELHTLHRALSEAGIGLVLGTAELDGERLWNSAVYLPANANEPAVWYRKSHLWGDYERAIFKADEPRAVTFPLGSLRVGMLICYDVEFPENVRQLALAGADLVVVPTALPDGSQAEFISRTLVPTRAFENQVAVAYVDHCGHDGRFAYAGRSIILGGDGRALASADRDGETLLVADIDPARWHWSREANTYLRDLHPAWRAR